MLNIRQIATYLSLEGAHPAVIPFLKKVFRKQIHFVTVDKNWISTFLKIFSFQVYEILYGKYLKCNLLSIRHWMTRSSDKSPDRITGMVSSLSVCLTSIRSSSNETLKFLEHFYINLLFTNKYTIITINYWLLSVNMWTGHVRCDHMWFNSNV